MPPALAVSDAASLALLAAAGLLAIGSAVYWVVVAQRAISTLLVLPTGRDGIELAAGEHKDSAARPITVIIPAHNEAEVIGGLVASLRAQDHPAFRVVLALDRCTDETGKIAREAIGDDSRFLIMEIDTCPEGWAGKVNAVCQAVAWTTEHRWTSENNWTRDDSESSESGRPGLLLFTDADCTFEPEALRAAAALLAERGLHLLSFLNELGTAAWYEWIAQPIAGFELMRQYPLLRVNRGGDRQRAFANGQFLLFDEDAYHAIGGHEAVKDELLEDIALARLIKEHERRGGLAPERRARAVPDVRELAGVRGRLAADLHRGGQPAFTAADDCGRPGFWNGRADAAGLAARDCHRRADGWRARGRVGRGDHPRRDRARRPARGARRGLPPHARAAVGDPARARGRFACGWDFVSRGARSQSGQADDVGRQELCSGRSQRDQQRTWPPLRASPNQPGRRGQRGRPRTPRDMKLRRSSTGVQLELTPLIDVVFLLLTFFIFSMILMVRADVLDVNVPGLGSAAAPATGEVVTIAVLEDGGVAVDGEMTSLDDLVAAVDAILSERPEARLVIAVDVDSRSGDLIAVQDRLIAGGHGSFGMLGRPGQQDSASGADP